MYEGSSRQLRDGLTAGPAAALLLSPVLYLFEQRRKNKCHHSAVPVGEQPEIGDAMPDGTIYAGLSPDTGEAMYTTPRGAGPPLTWKKALAFAAGLDAQGHRDWRTPTSSEMNHLFRNRAAIGGFDETRSGAGRWYWSSSPDVDDAVWGQHFSDGFQISYGKLIDSSLRCVS